MTQTPPSIRRLAEETAEKLGVLHGGGHAWAKWDAEQIAIIESALTTLATQIREEDARIVEYVGQTDFNVSSVAVERIVAAIRARQEK